MWMGSVIDSDIGRFSKIVVPAKAGTPVSTGTE
jgi:hypothetical protein